MVAEVPEEKLEQFRSDTLKEKLLSQIC